MSKLDYLSWLGVGCIWPLPFYQSQLRDGGYDISDYWTVLPEYRQVADVAQLVDEVYGRGIRVIADLVINHTSDQHIWFQESRQDRTNPKADWYVWSDDAIAIAMRGSFSSTPKNPIGHGTRNGASTTAPLFLAPARPQFREPRSG